MTFSHDQFLSFLLEAKRRTYAGQGDEATLKPLLPGSRQLEYRSGVFLYRDIYFGMAWFVGQETVYYAGRAKWSMCYSGGTLPTLPPSEIGPIYACLQLALRLGTVEQPYRGPETLSAGGYSYRNVTHGTINDFWGEEAITRSGALVYSLRYGGGAPR